MKNLSLRKNELVWVWNSDPKIKRIRFFAGFDEQRKLFITYIDGKDSVSSKGVISSWKNCEKYEEKEDSDFSSQKEIWEYLINGGKVYHKNDEKRRILSFETHQIIYCNFSTFKDYKKYKRSCLRDWGK